MRLVCPKLAVLAAAGRYARRDCLNEKIEKAKGLCWLAGAFCYELYNYQRQTSEVAAASQYLVCGDRFRFSYDCGDFGSLIIH